MIWFFCMCFHLTFRKYEFSRDFSSNVIYGHWHSITFILVNIFQIFKEISFDYASLTALSNTPFCIQSLIAFRNNMRSTYMANTVIRGQKMSKKAKRGQKCKTSLRDPFFCMKTHISWINVERYRSFPTEVTRGPLLWKIVKLYFSRFAGFSINQSNYGNNAANIKDEEILKSVFYLLMRIES